MSTTIDNLYGVVAANHRFIANTISLANNSTNDQKVQVLITLNSTSSYNLVSYLNPIPAGDTLLLDNLQLPVWAGRSITGKAETASSVDYVVWGIDIYDSTGIGV
jgi:hypothetical protein